MRSYDKTVLLPDLIPNFHEFIVSNLKDPSAADTSEMAVMFVTIDVFIVEVAIFEIDFLDQFAFDEEGKSSVNRGLRNDHFLVSQTQKELIRIKVIMKRENLLNDHLPLRCVPQPLLLDVFPEFLNRVHNLAIIIETHSR